MNEMTTDQALQLLDGAIAGMTLNRKDHAMLQQAIQTLAQAVAPKPETDEYPSKVKNLKPADKKA